MESISNFRDAALSGMKNGLLFRSAALDNATRKDTETILKKYCITTVVDLRGRTEHRINANDAPLIKDYYLHQENLSRRKLHRIDMAKPLLSYIKKNMPFFTVIIYLVLKFIGFKGFARKYVINSSILGTHGLHGLNMGILENSTKEMKRFFDVLAIETNYPILVHCSAGKDRTGLTMALTQELLNVPRTEIIQSYSESFKLLEKDHQRLKTEIEKSGLKPEFIDSDPLTLIKTFRFIDENFHSIRDYLESIDVNVEQQQKIIKILKK